MKTVNIRGIVIGEGMPKICVPIVEKTRESILSEAESFRDLPVDVVEWRADWYEDVCISSELTATLAALRKALGETPLLMTFRTKHEGGEREITPEEYSALNKAAIHSGFIDLVDIEMFSGDGLVADLIAEAHRAGVAVIGSNHDFEKTPDRVELIRRLRRMQELGADIPKIAVMPQSRADVLTLLSATEEMTTKYADRPVITMSMKNTGVISRICGEVFGSALTFGAAKKTSAPGQMGVKELRTVLQLLHDAL